MKLSVVIPTFNRRAEILQALADLYRQDHPDFEVIVVDDASTDGTPAAIRAAYPQVVVVEAARNGGPSIARNLGIERATGEIVVGLDSDVVFREGDALRRIERKLERDPRVAGLTFRILRGDTGRDDADRWWHAKQPLDEFADKEFWTDYFIAGGFAFRKAVLIDCGLFPDYLFMFNEEFDFSLRVLDRGYDFLYTPEIVVEHKVSATARVDSIAFYYKRRNQLWTTIRYYPMLRGVAYIAPRLAQSALLAARAGRLGLYLRSLVDGVRGIPRQWRARRPLRAATWRRKRELATAPLYEPPGPGRESAARTSVRRPDATLCVGIDRASEVS